MSPRRRFVLLVGAAMLVGCGLRVAIGLTDDAPSTDETAYLRSGSSLVEGDGFARGDRPELHFPPLVPFVLGTAGRFVDDPHHATVVMTVVCGTLLIVPLALLGRRLAGPDAGIATAWVAALAPGLATTPAARGAGSEAEYALLLVTATWLTVVAGDHAGARRALAAAGAGLLVGLAYLTRPEGLFVALPLAAALVLATLAGARRTSPSTTTAPERRAVALAPSTPAVERRREPVLAGTAGGGTDPFVLDAVSWSSPASGASRTGGLSRRRSRPSPTGRVGSGASRTRWPGGRRATVAVGGVGLAFLAPLVACVVPYMAFLHTHTGAWELTAKTQDASIEAWHAVARDDRQARDAVLYELDETGFGFTRGSSTLATLVRDDPAGYLQIVAANVAGLGRNLVGWWLLPLPVWVVAGFGVRRLLRSAAASTMWLLLAVAALPVATSLAFFVQPRYLVVTVALATVLVGAEVSAWTTRHRRALIAAGGALLALASVLAFYGPGGWWHPGDHTDQRRAGEWLRANTGDGDRIMTRSYVVDYYANRPTLAIPYADLDQIVAFGRHYGARYLVVDTYAVEVIRPQLAALAEDDRAAGLELVHEVVAEGRTTRIFAFDPPPPRPTTPDDQIPSLGFAGDGFG